MLLLLMIVPQWYQLHHQRGTEYYYTDKQPPAEAVMDSRRESPAIRSREMGLASTASVKKSAAQLQGQILASRVAPAPPAPMIARTVSLMIVVKDLNKSRSALDAILTRRHGYTATMDATSSGGPRGFRASLRIPADEVAAAVADFKTLGYVTSESQSGDEVTQLHEDLEARLKTARATEERFRAILQQRTGSISDVLEVEESIARVRGEIESMEAEQTTLEHRVEFATVEISLTEEYKAQLSSPADSVSTRMHNAFVAGCRNAWETVLGFMLFSEEYGPALVVWGLIFVLPGVFVWRRYRHVLTRM